MAITSKEQLKSYFETGDYPTEENFRDLIDTMLTREDIEGWDPGTSPGTVDIVLSETSMNPLANATVTAELKKKVSAEEGKGLSTNDYTDEEMEKLAGLENYDDRGIKKDIEDLSKKVEDLEQGGQGGSTPDLSEYLTRAEFYEASEGFATADALEGKQDTIEDLESIRSGAGKGATAVQPSTLEDYATTQQLTELSAEVSGLSERIENLPSGESSVFEAVYGETTYDEIVEASNSGKVVICKHLTYIARLTSMYGGNVIFTASEGTTTAQLRCDSGNRWYYNTSNAAHSLTTLDNGNAQITIAGKTAEVATPQYVENLLGTIINGEY